ncbi:MAG: alpha/beta hydrolase [Pedosphaera sp. Tous-C6FEB]|nr:MAG: alpha/beta hydrolase [Pedosphaera sp. Tous-C6FEB]
MNQLLLLAALALPLSAAENLPPVGLPRLERTNLLVYRDVAGNARPVKSAQDWERRRAEIVRGMERVMGILPGAAKRGPLEMKIAEETDCGSYTRQFITYQSEPGGTVPAYLLIPKDVLAGKRKAAAILCLHPTENTIGHKVVVGLGGKPNRQYASELAERGFVALAPSYPLLANYQPDLKALGWESGTLKAVWDNLRGLDLLASLPFVDAKSGFGAIGHSLGGHNAVYTGVFDTRLKVIVSSCGLDSYLDYMSGNPKVWEPEKGWGQTRYMPKLAGYHGRLEEIPFDFHEMVGALAPRVCFIAAPLKDSNFKWDSVDRVAAAAAPVYRLLGKPKHLIVEHPDCDHDFPEAMREKAYQLFRTHLKQ